MIITLWLKCIIFSLPINKELYKSKTITYKQFIDSFRFMSTTLSKVVDNLSEICNKGCKGCKEKKEINQHAILLDLKI